MPVVHPDIIAASNVEFFLAISQSNVHSSLMLGFVRGRGEPQLLARFGKTAGVDPDSQNLCKLFPKMLFSQGVSSLENEYDLWSRNPERKDQISYRAYSISYQQYLHALQLLACIQKKQRLKNDSQAKCFTLSAYQPALGRGNSRTRSFYYGPLRLRLIKNPQHEEIADKVQYITLGNTCRHTVKDISAEILGFSPAVSDSFLSKPDFKTTLKGGKPQNRQFYVLPRPPMAFDGLSKEQAKVAHQIYARLESLPKLERQSKLTWNKFEGLKGLYLDIVSEDDLSADNLLKKIGEHERDHAKALYKPRNFNLFIKLGLSCTATEKMLQGIKKDLESAYGIPLPEL